MTRFSDILSMDVDVDLSGLKEGNLAIGVGVRMDSSARDILTEEHIEKMKAPLKELSEIISNAFSEDFEKFVDEISASRDERKEELYNKMSKEEKAMVREMEQRIESAETEDEKIDILLDALSKSLRNSLK